MSSASQPHMHSAVEAVLNTLSGFFISWGMWVLVVAPVFDIPTDLHSSFWITCLFTITSVLRSYVWRRGANWWQHHRGR